MDLSFLDLLNTSISASWLVLAVIVLRFALHRAPRSIRCTLWALVAIRLLCPVSIESPLSLVPSAETVSREYLMEPAVHSTQQTVLDIVENPIYPQNVDLSIEAPISRVSVPDIRWSVIWVVGLSVMAAYALFSWLRVRRRVSASIPIASGIRICDHIGSPFILGVFRPVIYLPSDLAQDALDHVLAHEKAHLKRKDHWWKPLGFTLLSIHWFNPVMWLAYILLCRDIELACDEKVIRDMSPAQKKAYSAALLDCSVSRHLIAACPLAFGEVGVKERVKTVLNYRKPAFWIIVLSIILCAVVAVCFLTDPPKADTSENAQLHTETLPEGTYVSREKLCWAVYSSLYVYNMEMEVTDNNLMIRFNDGEWSEGPLPLDGQWQTECPISEKRRELLDEIDNIQPVFAKEDLTECRFLIVDDTHFIVEKNGNMYLVAWNHSNVGIEIIRYIFHFVPQAEFEDHSEPLHLGTVTLDTDPVEEAIYRYFMEQNSHEESENSHTSVSLMRHGDIYSEKNGVQLVLAAVRIGHYSRSGDNTISEDGSQLLPVRLRMARREGGTYEVTDCAPDDTDYSAGALVLEAECWRQAYAHFDPQMQTEIASVYADYPEYFILDPTQGLELLWWNTPEGVRCVIRSASAESDTADHTPLTVQESIAVLDYYDIPLQYLLSDPITALTIHHIDPP